MADTEPQQTSVDDNEEPDVTPGYKAPAQKSLDELKQLDADDESLVRYKQMLLSGAEAASGDSTGANVAVEKLSLVVEGRPDVDIDLTGDLTKLKEQAFVIKEGAEYRLKITFKTNGLIDSESDFMKSLRERYAVVRPLCNPCKLSGKNAAVRAPKQKRQRIQE